MWIAIIAAIKSWLPWVIDTAIECTMAPVYKGLAAAGWGTAILFMILWLIARNAKPSAK
jgi:hypothetical protein